MLISPVPNNPASVELNYLQKPVIPFRDYCQDAATLDSIFMPIGSVVHQTNIKTAVTYALYDSSDNLIYGPVVKDGATYPYTSKTVEIVLPEEVHESIVLAVLSKCSVNLQADQVTAYAETKEKEQ